MCIFFKFSGMWSRKPDASKGGVLTKGCRSIHKPVVHLSKISTNSKYNYHVKK